MVFQSTFDFSDAALDLDFRMFEHLSESGKVRVISGQTNQLFVVCLELNLIFRLFSVCSMHLLFDLAPNFFPALRRFEP